MSKKIQPLRRSYRPRRARVLAVAAGTALTGVSLWSSAAKAGSYVSYNWVNTAGGSWSQTGPSNWNDTVAVPDPTSINNQVIFNTNGASYSTWADFSQPGPVFNLSNLTTNIGSTDSVMLVPTPGQSSTIDTLNFVSDSSGDAPTLSVNSGSLAIQNQTNFSSGAVVTTAGGNLYLGSGSFGGANFLGTATFTNTGTGNLSIGSTVTSASNFNFASGTTFTNSNSGNLLIGANGNSGQIITFSGNTTVINSANGNVQLGDNVGWANSSAGPVTLTLENSTTGTFGLGDLKANLNGTLNIASGSVYAVDTGGDLFGNALVLNVAAGASFNFNNNSEGMGGLTGSGTVILGNAGLSFVEPGDRNFNGSISGTGGVAQAVANLLTLGGSNTYSGATTISADGTIRALAANVFSPNSVISLTAGTFDINGFNQTIAGLAGNNESLSLPLGSATLTINPAAGTSYTFFSPITGNGNVVINGPGQERLLGLNTYTGYTNISQGTLAINLAGFASSSVNVAAGATLDAIVPGNLTWTAQASGTGALIKDGPGTLTFSAPTTLTPSTLTIAAGQLVQDLTTNNSATFGSTTPLVLNGGSLSLLGNSTGASSQTFAGVTMASGTTSQGGYAVVQVVSGNNQPASINLGAITRNVGSVVDFELTKTGTSGQASVAASATLSSGILGGWATLGQQNWATLSGGVVVPLASYASTFASGNNTAISASTQVSGLTTVTNSLLINPGGAITFNNSSALLTLQSGGILVPSTVTTATSIGVAGTVGKLASSAATGELFINNYSSQPFEVYSAIQNNTSTGTNVVIAGTGTTIFNASNAYVGTTYLDSGTLQVAATGNLGPAASLLVINGGTLAIPSGSITVSNVSHGVTVGPAGATFNFGSSFSWTGNGLSGTGPILKTGTGTWSIGTNAAPYSGSVTVMSPGGIRFTSNDFTSITGLNISSGAQYLINDNSSSATKTETYNFAPSAALILAGDGPAGSTTPGAFAVTVQSGATYGPNTIFTNPINLAANASFGVWNSGSNFSTLTLTNQVSGPGNLTKLGDGMLTLTDGESTYGGTAGITTIVQGTLRDGVLNALAPTSTLQFGRNASATSGIFDLNGFNQTLAGLTVSSGTGHQIINSNATTPAVLAVNYNGNSAQNFTAQVGGGTIAAPVNANISFIKGGSGTLALSGTNTFTGPVTVASGTLNMTGSSASNVSRSYTVNDGATLLVTNTDATALPVTTLTLGSTSGANLDFQLNDGMPAAGAIAVNAAGGIITAGTTTIAVSSASPLSVGEYPLITYYAGTLTGAGFTSGFNPTVVVSGRTIATLVNNLSNGTLTGDIDSIDLKVSGVDFLKWSGTVAGGNWDIDNTANFNLNSSGAATMYRDNPSPDAVVFDDSATGTRLVNLTTTLNPSSVTINNSAGDYTFAGSGTINGSTGLIKTGTSNLYVLTNNTYTGTTTINGGTIFVGNGGTLGSLGPGPIVDNSSLAYNRSDSVTVSSAISGTGSLAVNGTGLLTFSNAVNIGGNLAINAGALTIAGGGSVAGNVTGPGSLTISSGPFQIGNGGTTGTLNVDTNLTNNATLVFDRSDSYLYSGAINGSGGINVANGSVTLTGNLNYSGSTVIGNNSLTLSPTSNTTLYGAIVGTGTINYNGSGQLLLLAKSNGYTGNLVINSGSVMVADESYNGQEGEIDSANIIINNGGRFIFGMGGIPGENPNLPNSTYITINTGGTYEIRVGEDWGGASLQGGTYLVNGGVGSTFSGTQYDYPTPPFLGFDLQSGSVQAINGTATFNASGAAVNKTTSGTVTFTGPMSWTAGVPINLEQGVLSFQSNNIPTSGTGAVTIGNNLGPAVFQLSSGSATLSRPVALGTGADIDLPAINSAPGATLTISSQITGGADLYLTGAGTLKLSGSNNYSGNTNIAGGTLVLNTTGSIGASPLVEVNTNAVFQLAAQTNRSSPIFVRTLPAINLSSGGLVSALISNQQSNRQILVPASVSLSGASGAWTSKIDLGNNDMIIHGSTLGIVSNQVAQGYANGTWQGSGGITSSAAASDPTHLTALGVLLNDNGTVGAVTNSFDTTSTGDGDVLIKYTYYGDANLDGTVSSADYTLIDGGYLSHGTLTGWQNGDFNYDNTINGSDYTLIDNAFNQQGASLATEVASPTAQVAGGVASVVPEPASLGLLALAGLGLLGRRRRA